MFVPPDHPHSYSHLVTLGTRYLDIVDLLDTPTTLSAVRAHLYRMLKPVLDEDEDNRLRIMIARCHFGTEGTGKTASFREVLTEVERVVQVSLNEIRSCDAC